MATPLPDLSNEQKLTYIYHTLKAQEKRRRFSSWIRGFKWVIVLAIVYCLVQYPSQIFTKMSELIKPIVMDQAQTLLEENRASIAKSLNALMKNIKDLIVESELSSAANTSTTTTPPVTKEKVTTPTKPSVSKTRAKE